MARDFWHGLLAGLFGAAIGIIVVAAILKLKWDHREAIVILATQGIVALTVIFVRHSNKIKKEERMEIEAKFEAFNKSKAGIEEITRIECLLDVYNENLKHNSQCIEEMHTTIDNVYQFLIKKKK